MAKHGNMSKLAALDARERKRNKSLLRAFAVVVALAAAFVLGFALRGQETLLASLGFSVDNPAAASQAAVRKTAYNSVSARLSEVEDAMASGIDSSFDLDKATADVLRAFVGAGQDDYLEYLDPARYSAYVKENSKGSYAGIGALFADYNGRAYVSDVFEGSAAQAAGVQQGDYVIGIDGDVSHDWSVTETINSLAREDGATVVITWMRPSSLDAETGSEFTTALVCSEYDEQNVTSSMEGGTVGYIKIRQFTQNVASTVSQAVSDLTAQGAESFVLDVRDNPGGYLTQAVGVANLFVKTGVIVEVETADGTTSKTASGETATDAPLVVIANGYTSAAAEVLVAALQDNQRATVVGETTVGKGSVQVTHELSFGGALRYTAALYKSPLGHDIDGVGVIPDISMSAGDGATDAQLLLAVETAQSAARK